MMNLDELLRNAQEAVTVRRVFGEPQTVDGVTVIPAAVVSGGGGGGGGSGGPNGESGEGGGYGLSARPAGAYVIEHGQVRWRPAVDVNGAIGRFAVVAVVFLLTRWRVQKVRARRSR